MIEETDHESSDEENGIAATSTTFLGQLKLLLYFIVIWQFAFNISNAAITNLLHFMKHFISALGHAFRSDTMQDMGDALPVTLQSVHRLISLQDNDFIKYVVCPKCESIYDYKNCFVIARNGQKESKNCVHVSFPNHPQLARRTPCGAMLLKKVRVKHGYVLSTIKAYPYKPLRRTVELLAKRKGFLQCCEHWRDRAVPHVIFMMD